MRLSPKKDGRVCVTCSQMGFWTRLTLCTNRPRRNVQQSFRPLNASLRVMNMGSACWNRFTGGSAILEVSELRLSVDLLIYYDTTGARRTQIGIYAWGPAFPSFL